MIQEFKGLFSFDKDTVSKRAPDDIGVYYCGVKNTLKESLNIYYVGRAIGEEQIKGRLLQHLGENKWSDVTHFGFHVCDTKNEAIKYEADEIKKYKPKYNVQGK